jgi:hypothetical protein
MWNLEDIQKINPPIGRISSLIERGLVSADLLCETATELEKRGAPFVCQLVKDTHSAQPVSAATNRQPMPDMSSSAIVTNSGKEQALGIVAQNDGNLVIYDSANRPLWATNTVVPVKTNSRGFQFEGELYKTLQCETIEVVHLADGRLMLLDEEGKHRRPRKPINYRAARLVHEAGGSPFDVVVGDVAILDADELH